MTLVCLQVCRFYQFLALKHDGVWGCQRIISNNWSGKLLIQIVSKGQSNKIAFQCHCLGGANASTLLKKCLYILCAEIDFMGYYPQVVAKIGQ